MDSSVPKILSAKEHVSRRSLFRIRLRDNENGKKFSGEPEEFTFRRQLKCSGDICDFVDAAG
jgi:hypothetical protein